ncbi:MAG: CopG family transcriptional regulator [Candidatus Bathyarchaeia archaeon]
MGFQVTPNKTLATTAVSIKLPDAAAVKVENLATKNGLTRGNIVAQMVDYALSNLNTVKKKKK